MNIHDFNFILPEQLIAQYPLAQRTSSRLLCLERATSAINDRLFPDLLHCLRPNDLLVFNNTRVMPARLLGHKETGGKVEVLIERVLSENRALAHVGTNKRCQISMKIFFDERRSATVMSREGNLFELHFEEPIVSLMQAIGHMPLPPYIDRADELADRERYQTVYSSHLGAVAAPTAGLHFDEPLLESIRALGVQTAFVTLHVGAGTFQPVKVDNPSEHKMHQEWISVPQATCDHIHRVKKQGGRVIAVGTTVVRTLESVAQIRGELSAYEGETDIFIYPPYAFQCVDALVTNFHLPKSTLLMLVSAFASREQILHAYQHAISKAYRFFSYGDAMFIY